MITISAPCSSAALNLSSSLDEQVTEKPASRRSATSTSLVGSPEPADGLCTSNARMAYQRLTARDVLPRAVSADVRARRREKANEPSGDLKCSASSRLP